MKKKNLVLLIIVLFFLKQTRGQDFSGFSGNVDTYITELGAFFQTTPQKADKKTGELITNRLRLLWNGGNLTLQDKESIVEVSVLMLNRKMRPFPQFQEYLDVVFIIFETNQKKQTFIRWQNTLKQLLNLSRTKPFLDFISFSNPFFKETVLYSSATTTWKAKTKDYEYFFDTIPYIVFDKTMDLACYANNDSSVIIKTTGTFYPFSNIWEGNKGTINWIRAGFKPADLYVELKKYEIDVRYREYKIDNVLLYYPEFFGLSPISGNLEEKVLANRSGEDALYPKFESIEERFTIKNIFKNIDYEGGITIRGARLHGTGDNINPANLYLHREGTLFMKFSSDSYIIRKDRISSDRAAVTIYVKGDSIYHPGIPLTYNDKNRTIQTVPEREGMSRAPYFNTYHKLEMDFEAMYWKIDEPEINFQMIIGPGAEGNATFTSANYFCNSSFERLKGIDERHPLLELRNYANSINSRVFTVMDFAKYRRIQSEQIRNQIIILAIQGFVHFDPSTDKIFLKDKIYDHIACYSKKTDYDVIQFHSVTLAESNSKLCLHNFDLKMNGVSRIFLSDSQMVQIFPKEQEIVIKENRDFIFHGKVRVGLFDYFGNDFSFEYDKFKVNMPVIDSMSFRVKRRTPDEYGYYPYIRVKSTVEDMSGDILIDQPANKSGLKPFKEYPVFNSKKYSYVYYDKTSVYPGVYDRGDFFYRIDPFQLDSMNELTTDGIEFSGYLSSAGIFPDIEQPLKVQHDYSLGFTYLTPQEGLPVYEDKGIFTNQIDLSNQGLLGEGTLNYLTSTSVSDNFVFFPEKLFSEKVDTFNIAESTTITEYPLVNGKNVKLQWLPYKDKMYVQTIDIPFLMYAENTHLTGELTLSSSELTGTGVMEFANASITSKEFSYKSREFNTDTCDFTLKTYDLRELAFITENYRGNVNFEERKGEFISNGGTSLVKFPANQYICYMDRFNWYMDLEEIDLSTDIVIGDEFSPDLTAREIADLDLAGSEFISVHPEQDSLKFKSARAKYNLTEQNIYAYDVRLINVADAAIIPSDGQVTILKKAEILPLENAQILANTTTKFHLITNASVKILGRKKYTASGYYEYIDEMEGSHILYLHNITVDTTLQTVGEIEIPDTAILALSSFFDFQGNINLFANNELLTFTGGVRIKHNCDTIPLPWMKFTSPIDPWDINIPVNDELYDIDGNRIYAGIYCSYGDAAGAYSAFLQPKLREEDNEIMASKGWLMYDKITNEYRISSEEKLKQLTLPGNYLSLSVFKCQTTGEGKLNLETNLGRINMNFYGKTLYNIPLDSIFINAVVELDFYFNDNSINLLKETILKSSELKGININSELYTKYLGEIFGLAEADKIIAEMSLYGQLKKVPDKLNHTITFIDLSLIYNKETKSYQSVGPIGIGSIGTNQINRYLDGRLEIQKRRGGDKLTFYLETEPSVWFFFTYANNIMHGFSSEKAFNDFVTETKPDERQLSTKGGEKAYSYYISTERRKDAFLKKTEIETD